MKDYDVPVFNREFLQISKHAAKLKERMQQGSESAAKEYKKLVRDEQEPMNKQIRRERKD